jgi:DnaJ-class molecular chaperone
MVSDKQQALKILGLSDGATDEEIREAYKRMSIKW